MIGLLGCAPPSPPTAKETVEERATTVAFRPASAPRTSDVPVRSGADAASGFTLIEYARYMPPTYANSWGSTSSGTAVGAEIGDFNGDGLGDAAAMLSDMPSPDWTRVWIFLQKPDGTLADPLDIGLPSSYAIGSYIGSAVGDMNGDGATDLVVAQATRLSLVLSDPKIGPHRVDFATPPLPIDVAPLVADFNEDGHADVAVHVSRYGGEYPPEPQSRLIVYYGNGKGGIANAAVQVTGAEFKYDSERADALALGDFNHDGWVDIVAKFWEGDYWAQVQRNVVKVLKNSKGVLQPPQLVHQNNFAKYLTAGDITGDGRDDVIFTDDLIAPPGASLWTLAQLPNDQLSTTPTPMPGNACLTAMLVRDIDGDGARDFIAACDGGAGFYVYLQRNGSLAAPMGFAMLTQGAGRSGPDSLALGDINHDLCNDVVASVGYDGIWIFHGSGCTRRAIKSAPLSPVVDSEYR